MRLHSRSAVAATVFMLAIGADAALAQDADRAIADGGIKASGWAGTIDARAAAAGQTIHNARFAEETGKLLITTGPAATYWKSAERLSGSYTVSATFTEPEYMNLNSHPHPYGIVVAGNDMGGDKQSYLYCAAYGNGQFIVRGFGPEPFQMNGRRGEAHDAVNKAAGKGQPVTQRVAMSVRDGTVSCSINGTVVASYPVGGVVTAGRLASTDGVYGIRAAHNTDIVVSELTVTRH